MSAAVAGVAAWHDYMHGGSTPEKLNAMLAEHAVFHSPVVHTPQEGKAKVFAYLHAAAHVLGNDSFHYVREIIDGDSAMLEFTLELDGIQVNGVDIIRWNADGKIEDFKVMVRPMKAMNKVWEKMGEMLAKAG
ncbi:MAG: nuclear transport factor 2 family protein [Blastomonas sp.]|uniref:nuclear transport factor 2 family protein n=1 Tax=Blastomonas TaxID=150203 RepID=UPI0024E1D17F|nr:MULTISPECIES: nuclear transport factor 2 family protein [Blastomonas]MCO5791407.1 nuclear transport factor 2 family protein [Blastomonas sp.]MDK2756277.1 nuclear transport factor 2 family protein [Blastomonas fulva]